MSSNNGLIMFKSPLQRVDKNNEIKHRKFAEKVAKRHGLQNFYEVLEIYERCYEICMELCDILGTNLNNLRNELEKYIPLDPLTMLHRKFCEFVMQLAKDDKDIEKELSKTYRLFYKMYVEKKPFSNAIVEVFNEFMESKKE
ncbi:hypothetical protein [Archaeoglobus profundus]|uniref:Uncharacterized protein n=1 Tax=Archaeoglobus profundus (strain DSM 5631 / JCM 9629 / NBRC 100127 / Av18) TaxID=572546 RepID=D2RF94_ARCPA|nr:hypothetical protein [Archaeoglobus profundus]ADB58788.1 hypothetical protein Arcpr_1744 [Archaeoglobus profundus DSM 5631]